MTDTPLGLYVHWPYCARICPYCDFNVYRARGDDSALFDALLADLAYWAGELLGRKLTSLHFGGGTPSLLKPEQIGRIVQAADRFFGFECDAEIGLEANPNDAAGFRGFSDAGINRLSLGVQSFDDDALKALGRDHDGAASRMALEAALSCFARVSIDVIYAREGQTAASWASELSDVLALGVSHLSLYQLTIEPGTAFFKRVERGEIKPPGDALGERLYRTTQALCQEAGFLSYEISNHAKPGAESRHNRLYWEGADWIGIGPGAHGRIGSHALGGRRAVDTALRPADYIRRVSETGTGSKSEKLSALDEVRERILMGLRIDTGLDLAQLEQVTGLTVDEDEAARYLAQGWLTQNGTQLRLTGEGRLLADGLAAALCP
ncbi:radical SAM family heme chaperone HemW [Hyphobacterium indicum]|uniref:radical SAM family heme chaperone HemW n=1 Tax=Hyphobacterium indicum TaxID=2162714 RepID=UPI000D65AD73|nr:radical SAM family heme chaperone HemW [Hyphobacterium indicum]